MTRITGTKNITPNTPNTDQTVSAPSGDVKVITSSTGQLYVAATNPTDSANVNNPFEYSYDPTDIFGSPEQRRVGGAYFAGGVGIEKDLNVGGYIYGRVALANTSSQLIIGSTNTDQSFYLTFTEDLNSADGSILYGDDNLGSSGGLLYNPGLGKLTTNRLLVESTDQSTSPTTGAAVVKGGLGVEQDIFAGQNITVTDDINIGGVIYPINEDITGAYLEDLYSNFLDSPSKRTNTLPIGAGMTDMFGDIRVRGSNPIGTAPVVTNILYVTMDGNDTNDGRAEDASRACRTIGGAINSPYYQSGTQIRVAPGRYLEDNPLRLKPYTSIMGSDIRTTGVEPINKTQDLFHLESGCYLAFMQFLNGRSGLLEGPYASGFNRGAYATAFPPLTGEDKIDLFHSPYVQNCTNMSGPWLRDGTMFIPNQTVQVPAAVGTGTWAANVSSITVHVNTGTIERGMKINAGNQNQGFFDARTLMLANKPFLQEQVVAYVNQTYPSFEYNQEKCFRDVGILVENAAYDAAFGGNEKSVESGLAYYRGVVSLIAGQEEQTTAAIDYLNSLTQSIIVNTTVTDLLSGLGKFDQVRNTVLTGGAIASDSLNDLFGIITTIIDNGPTAAPSVYKSTGPDAAFVSAEILMQANRKFIQENVINYINNELSYPPKNLKFNKIKCKRDVGLIVDSVALDMLYPTSGHSQSTFAGLQYFTQGEYVDDIPGQITTTTAAISYLKDLVVKVIQNITPADDLVDRYSVSIQDTSLEPASEDEVKILKNNFDVILDIISGNNLGWSDKIVSNGAPIDLQGIRNAVAILEANKEYLKDEVIAYIEDPDGLNFPSSSYNPTTCRRDVGYIVDSVSFDLSHGGNRQSVQSGLSYYGFESTRTIRESEKAATLSAFEYIADLSRFVIKGTTPTNTYQTRISQVITASTGTDAQADLIDIAISTVTSILENGTGTAVWGLSPISTATSVTTASINAFNLLLANKEFIKAEVVARVDNIYNPNSFNYNEDLCYRDTGLIVDAVSQDILLGGNQKSVQAGLSYWNQGYSYVATQVTTTTSAINYARDIALQIIANTTVTSQSGTVSTQVINPFFQYGGDYMPQEAVSRNFGIITNIIENGPTAAPPVYEGGGVSPLTGINGLDVKLAPVVTSVVEDAPGVYTVGLNTSTIGFGINSTLYFGNTAVFPAQDADVPAEWAQRRIDPVGSMGGSLVDGAVISSRSPINSFVYDAFTQVTQGGRGIFITNNGYAQLVSVFTIFCSTGVQVDNGGIASIVNSNANFGDLCLVAKGYGKREFSGTVFNPKFRAYPFSPLNNGTTVVDSQELDQYYPNGFWPNRGTVEIFTPDLADRPHISLIMEVEPPDGHLNEQSFPGFLNAQPSTSTLTTSSIVLTNIDTTDVAVGNTVYIRNQFGYEYDNIPFLHDVDGNPIDIAGLPTTEELAPANPDYLRRYVATGTVVTDVGYNAITLNLALTHGGGDPTNPNYFTLYFCGNSYYTVLSSTVANSPYKPGNNLLWSLDPADPNYQAPVYDNVSTTTQVEAHVAAIEFLNSLVTDVIGNVSTTATNTTTSQTILPLVTGGSGASAFIDLRFGFITDIIGSPDITAAQAVVPSRAITKTGTVVPGAGSAVILIEANKDFLADEVTAWVHTNHSEVFVGLTDEQVAYIDQKCKRDTKVILTRMIYDLETGGTYNSVYSGLSYWARPGTHHIIELGEAVRRTDLFPDGATVNFYQRSYMSASGYVFEYVGAGTNYGSLPQVGRADPIQSKETVQLNSGKVFFTSTDQNGDFRIGPGLVISQATGVLSGRTFTQSLFANMTPFILAIEG